MTQHEKIKAILQSTYDLGRSGLSGVPTLGEVASGLIANGCICLPCKKGDKLMYNGIEYTVDHWNILATAFAELDKDDLRPRCHLFDIKAAEEALVEGGEDDEQKAD